MDIIAAYREAGTFRGAAEIAGTTHKTVKRVSELEKTPRPCTWRASPWRARLNGSQRSTCLTTLRWRRWW
jgi:hypothetical protein